MNPHHATAGAPPASARSRRGLEAVNFFAADVQDGLGPFLGVFLQAAGWKAGAIGTAMTGAGIAALLATAPAGALVDGSRHKRLLVSLACVLTVSSSCLILLSTAFPVVLLSQVMSSLCGALIGPAVTGLTLGLVRRQGFDRQIGRNQVANHAGNVVAAALSGYLGWRYGLIAVFVLSAIFAVLSIACTQLITPGQIDNRAARGIESDEPDATNTRWSVLLRSRPLLLLGVALMVFHFGNAAMLPLFGQAAVAGRLADPALFTATTVIVAQLVMVLAALATMRLMPRHGHWWILLIAFAALPIRGLVAALTLHTSWGVYPVQILDGVGAGLQSVAVPALVASLMAGTGRTNAALGVVLTMQGLGAAFSPAFAGWIAQWWGYRSAFLVLGGVSLFALGLWVAQARALHVRNSSR